MANSMGILPSKPTEPLVFSSLLMESITYKIPFYIWFPDSDTRQKFIDYAKEYGFMWHRCCVDPDSPYRYPVEEGFNNTGFDGRIMSIYGSNPTPGSQYYHSDSVIFRKPVKGRHLGMIF